MNIFKKYYNSSFNYGGLKKLSAFYITSTVSFQNVPGNLKMRLIFQSY